MNVLLNISSTFLQQFVLELFGAFLLILHCDCFAVRQGDLLQLLMAELDNL